MDEKLKWNGEETGVSLLHMADHEIWQPDLTPYNRSVHISLNTCKQPVSVVQLVVYLASVWMVRVRTPTEVEKNLSSTLMSYLQNQIHLWKWKQFFCAMSQFPVIYVWICKKLIRVTSQIPPLMVCVPSDLSATHREIAQKNGLHCHKLYSASWLASGWLGVPLPSLVVGKKYQNLTLMLNLIL